MHVLSHKHVTHVPLTRVTHELVVDPPVLFVVALFVLFAVAVDVVFALFVALFFVPDLVPLFPVPKLDDSMVTEV